MSNGEGTSAGLISDVIRGLIYTHNRANANTAEVHQTSATLHALIELLVERRLLDRETLEARCQEESEQLRQQYITRGMAVAMQEFKVSKYNFAGGATIDCENRVHLCEAACCRLPLALSKEDVQEGMIRWDLGQPYLIARGKDGYCTHLERGTCAALSTLIGPSHAGATTVVMISAFGSISRIGW